MLFAKRFVHGTVVSDVRLSNFFALFASKLRQVKTIQSVARSVAVRQNSYASKNLILRPEVFVNLWREDEFTNVSRLAVYQTKLVKPPRIVGGAV